MINYEINWSTQKDIQKHLEDCSNSFIPPLNTYVNIQKYSKKIFTKSIRFESWYKNELIGLLAIYSNTSFNKAFLTNLSLNNKYENKGIGHKLVRNCKSYLISKQMNNIDLEVNIQNHKAIKFYKKNNFVIKKIINNNYLMSINIKRDYNKEIKDAKDHKYAYNFDFDVMHPFMLKSFIPFFNKGNLLELGSFKGEFTKRFLPYFDDITCIEASDEAVKIARKEFDKKSINIINDVFDTRQNPTKMNDENRIEK
mgnify:FL=1